MIKGFINNDWDRENLEFLLNTKGDDFTEFWAQSDEDDKKYAQELLDAYARELQLKSELLEIESQLEDNLTDAKVLLKKFALN
jgi:hypothetical protein